MKHLFLLFIFSIFLICSCGEDCTVGRSNYTFETTIEGEQRKAIIVKPVNECIKSPVLFYFHGRGPTASAKNSQADRKFHNIDLLNDMYIVYAEGTNYDMRSDGSKAWVMRFPHVVKNCPDNDKDLKYLQAIIDHLEEDDQADINNMGACGHSNGGFFTLSLAEVWSDVFKGFASVGSYTNYIPDLTLIDCEEPYTNGIIPSWASIHNVAIQPNPAPTLFIFGDMETVITQPAYEADCYTFSYFQNSIHQLCFKNLSEKPNCDNENFMTNYSRQIFKAGPGGVDTHVQLYAGTHSWPAEANTYVAEFFADLLYP